MDLRRLAILFYAASLAAPGFYLENGTQGPLGFQMVILGVFAIERFDPSWIWGSYLANLGFFYCCFSPHSPAGKKRRNVISVISLLLGLSFLLVKKYTATGAIGHNSVLYSTTIEQAAGYYLWLISLALIVPHTFSQKVQESGTNPEVDSIPRRR